jgi:hypothetical protein
VWGAGKQRASGMYFPGRTLAVTRLHLRMGFYGGDDGQGTVWKVVDVAGCWRKAEREMNRWIAADLAHVADGLHGTITDLQGWEAWTSSSATCLNIQDMDVEADPGPVEAGALADVDAADEHDFSDDDEEEDGELPV